MSTDILVIPKQLELLAAQNNVSRNLTLSLIREFGVSVTQMTEVIECVAEFSAKPRKVLEMTSKHKICVSEVWSIYEIRDSFKKADDSISLNQIALFNDAFKGLIDFNNLEQLYDLLSEIVEFYDTKGRGHSGSCIKWFLEDQERQKVSDPWQLLEELKMAAGIHYLS